MNHIIQAVYERLTTGKTVVLVKIVHHEGSTPRSTGTQMVVTRDGNHVGTIGGGLLESKAIEQGIDLLGEETARLMPFDLTHEMAASMNMVCGGRVEVLLDPLAPSDDLVSIFRALHYLEKEHQEYVFVTVIEREGPHIKQIHHGLVDMDGRVQGHLPLTDNAVKLIPELSRKTHTMATVVLENYNVILEPITFPETAFIIGAGHVAQPTAHMAALVGFRVVVMDDRKDFANPKRFPDADDVVVLNNFENPFDAISIDQNSFVIIVTRGHLHDKTVLGKTLKTNAGYIGMIGSRKKRDAIYQQLINEGFTEDDLKRVHSPIGLDIGAETPEEIAVSIVSELIAEKRKRAN
jgi:xanthine dehydrogenase accessory factor